jgi:hypothetical protein
MEFTDLMFSKLKQIFMKIEHVLLVVLVIFSASFLYKAKDAKAITQTTITGSCGIMFNFNINGWELLMIAHQPSSFTKNAFGTLNFDGGTSAVRVTNVTSYGDTNTVTEASTVTSGTLTLTGFEADTGLYQYSVFNPSTNSTVFLNVLPTNSGNTLLISAYYMTGGGALQGPLGTGICQKI